MTRRTETRDEINRDQLSPNEKASRRLGGRLTASPKLTSGDRVYSRTAPHPAYTRYQTPPQSPRPYQTSMGWLSHPSWAGYHIHLMKSPALFPRVHATPIIQIHKDPQMPTPQLSDGERLLTTPLLLQSVELCCTVRRT
ncbi:hypothetical protein Hamer_G001251 [Homarus americanus]|uniref:Uncharacterized protein n=1 Tax=Homarus americanus TaxID=6706 RepID=A0A8J5N9D9_HOMAM|nr:hypothetical protein Hamer_G001251 [Homarus americanus]